MKRRFLSILLSLAMLLALFPPGTARAADEGHPEHLDGDVAVLERHTDDTTTYLTEEEFFTIFNTRANTETDFTLTLLDDVTVDEPLYFNGGNITLDCGGHTLTETKPGGGAIVLDAKAGDVTVRNGTVESVAEKNSTGGTSAGIRQHGGTLHVELDATICATGEDSSGIQVNGGSTVIAGKVQGTGKGVDVGAGSVTIDGAEITSAGIGMRAYAAVTLKSGTITGDVNAMVVSKYDTTLKLAEGSNAMLGGKPLDIQSLLDEEDSGPGTVIY